VVPNPILQDLKFWIWGIAVPANEIRGLMLPKAKGWPDVIEQCGHEDGPFLRLFGLLTDPI
jgi:hypothetical protein